MVVTKNLCSFIKPFPINNLNAHVTTFGFPKTLNISFISPKEKNSKALLGAPLLYSALGTYQDLTFNKFYDGSLNKVKY